ncbi:MAG: flagellar biosynthetic protein FliO [Oscillospiraceae bacterium]|jgi:flagellar biogenesis protein FliO|nr:flagellar biosynthetic protein FliO [Oscillospiraceae bacterium]
MPGAPAAIVVIVVFLAALFFVSIRLSSRGARGFYGGSRLIRIRERLALSNDKMLCVAEFNGKLYLIALTNGAVEVLESLDASALAQPLPENPGIAESFKRVWESRKGGRD